MDTVTTLLKFLKKKRIINDISQAKDEVRCADVMLRKDTDLFVRDAITGLGTIILEDLEDHYYITSVKVGTFGNALAYTMVYRGGSGTEIVVYAHEGIIKQHLADKALEKLKKVLC